MENSLPKYITLTEDNIDKEHICCAFSDKKCLEGYESKKEWLKKEFANGYVFRRLDARAKVFIEYVPAEYAWLPVTAPNYLMINCFWVSGQYKGQGPQSVYHLLSHMEHFSFGFKPKLGKLTAQKNVFRYVQRGNKAYFLMDNAYTLFLCVLDMVYRAFLTVNKNLTSLWLIYAAQNLNKR